MRAFLLAAAMLMGCGTNDDHSDLHEQATCSGWTKADGTPLTDLTKCERACASPPPAAAYDPARQCAPASNHAPILAACQYFEFEGVNGCCEWDTGQPTSTGVMGFYECGSYPN